VSRESAGAPFRVAVATLFPELFTPFFAQGVIGRAVDTGRVELRLLDIRDWAVDARGSVDDYQFGGGAGMLLRPEPLFGALESLPWRLDARVVLMTPQGRALDHSLARELAESPGLIVFCGRYGGIDQRFTSSAVTDEVSVCDAVVSGGEVPAMLLLEAVLRWLPGVLGRMESAESDSFATGLLDFPRYTRPAEYRGMKVPETLISGNHAGIEAWRYREALSLTRERRPDLLGLDGEDNIRERFLCAMRSADRRKNQEQDEDG
jgi:tRNA (guanine37-N1)-methyltransferase